MNMYRFHDKTLVARTRRWFFVVLGLAALALMGLGLWWAWSAKQNIADLQNRIDRVSALPQPQADTGDVFFAAESPNIAQTRLQTQIQEQKLEQPSQHRPLFLEPGRKRGCLLSVSLCATMRQLIELSLQAMCHGAPWERTLRSSGRRW